jgi:hypothetical protein
MTEQQPAATGPTYADCLGLVRTIQKDVTDANAKLTTLALWLANQAAGQPTTSRDHACPKCGVAFLTQPRLDDHLANVHGQ